MAWKDTHLTFSKMLMNGELGCRITSEIKGSFFQKKTELAISKEGWEEMGKTMGWTK